LLRQPDKVGFTLLDDDTVQDIVDKGWLLPRFPSMGSTSGFREDMQAAAAKKQWVAAANTWEEIAEWIGTDPTVLKATIEEYNAFCDHGYDATFVKDRRYLVPLRKPPFYVIKYRTLLIETCGPVRVDEEMQVLDKGYKPIPGLYVAGALASGWQGHDYCGDHLFGSALGFSMNSGRIAGENAARYSQRPDLVRTMIAEEIGAKLS
jgi:fumarate reductase flavoprotein subunit